MDPEEELLFKAPQEELLFKDAEEEILSKDPQEEGADHLYISVAMDVLFHEVFFWFSRNQI